MDNMILNFVNRIVDLTKAAQKPERFGEGDSAVYMMPDGSILRPWEQQPPAPRWAQASPSFYTVDSFVAYVLRFRQPGTVVICDAVNGTARAWIDYHDPNPKTAAGNSMGEVAAKWRKHTATFTPQLSEEWKKWHAKSGKLMDQEAFAAVIEENERLLLTPPAGHMLKIASDLEGTMSVKWQRGTDTQTGLHKMQWVAEGNMKAGQLDVPKKFTLALQILLGSPSVEVANWLRVKIANPLQLSYEIDRPEAMLQNAYTEAFRGIEIGLTPHDGPAVPVFAGSVKSTE